MSSSLGDCLVRPKNFKLTILVRLICAARLGCSCRWWHVLWLEHLLLLEAVALIFLFLILHCRCGGRLLMWLASLPALLLLLIIVSATSILLLRYVLRLLIILCSCLKLWLTLVIVTRSILWVLLALGLFLYIPHLWLVSFALFIALSLVVFSALFIWVLIVWASMIIWSTKCLLRWFLIIFVSFVSVSSLRSIPSSLTLLAIFFIAFVMNWSMLTCVSAVHFLTAVNTCSSVDINCWLLWTRHDIFRYEQWFRYVSHIKFFFTLWGI